MLYIFQVDLGCMYTFELDLSLESVSALKNAITAKCNISFDNQVLLISGGDYLEDNCLVHQYDGAGTVSNPIFLFNKSAIMSPEQYSFNQPQSQNDQYIDSSLKQIQIIYEDTLELDASLKTIVARTDVAKKLNQLTTELKSTCEQLIRDQHLMYQGWQAVIANLEDVAVSFVDRVKNFEEQLKLFLTKRDYYGQKLKNFSSDLEILDQVKTLPCLHGKELIKDDVLVDDKSSKESEKENVVESKANTKDENDDKTSDKDQIEESTKETIAKEDTLMNLISQKDKKHCLDKVVVYCKTMLEQFNEQLLDRVKEEMDSLVKTIDDNKKIKKIESRLYNLDMLLLDVHQIVQDQNMLTFGFIQNQNSANTYNDPTIFNDLCSSHKTQLDLMFSRLNKAMSIKKKFQNSKRELTYNLLDRLKTIMICETELNSLNWRVLLYGESLKKLKRSLEVVDQINLAPKVYFTVFREVNRRNQFNFFFKLWSRFIVQMNSQLIANENKQRNDFRKLISSHFLLSFFPKFDDDVPEFACNLPEDYDQCIPLVNEREFCDFIEQNKQFDRTLEQEDNLLNGFVYRMNDGQVKSGMIEISKIQANENEIASLANFVDSLMPSKEKQKTELEEMKERLKQEYESRLNALKEEYKVKLDEELKKLNQQQDLSLSSISNNIACVEQSVVPVQEDGQKSSNEESLLNSSSSRQTLFKNLVNELLSMKYTDYLKDNEIELIRPITGPFPFISFVSTIISLAVPRLR